MIYQLYLSFTSWDMISPTKTFVGFENYANMLTNGQFWFVVFNTFYFMGAVVAGSVAIGLALALLLNQKLFGRDVVRSIVFTPVIISGAAIGLVWTYIFDPNYGLMRSFLAIFGVASPDWLGSTALAMPALIIVYLWKNLGFAAVVYVAALQNIDRELYEAAHIDGASEWSCFWRITLPQLSPATFFVVVITVIQSFSYNAFDIIAVMTGGGPVDATTTLIWYIYQEGFVAFRVGTAAAAATVLFVMLLAVTLLQNRYLQRKVHYQ